MTAILQPATSVLADRTSQVQPPIEEVEPNDSAQDAQALSSIGAANYVNAQINTGGDVDWYKFTAEANQTYVVELFNVDMSLNTPGGNCFGGSIQGVGFAVYDSTIITNPNAGHVIRQCEPNGLGNVQSLMQFDSTGSQTTYYIKVVPNASTATGNYHLRVLPEYSNQNAEVGWDNTIHEPNNTIYQAYEIAPGRTTALTSQIEARNGNYVTVNSDLDWYRFNAQANKTYVIELFEVDRTLGNSGGNCFGGNIQGLGVKVYNPLLDELSDARECIPNGAGNVQSISKFRTTSDGWHHIQVIANNENVSGSYKIRVLPEYNDNHPTQWDSNYEPNNWASHSYGIGLGQNNALISQIESHNSDYVTHTEPDEDWYHFSAQAGQTYKIELFDVEPSLADPTGGNCFGGNILGVGLEVYDPSIIPNPNDSLGIHREVRECEPNGTPSDGFHNSLEFTPDESKTYHIRVFPNADNASGNYSIRVLGEAPTSVTLASLRSDKTNLPAGLVPVALVGLLLLAGLTRKVRRRKA